MDREADLKYQTGPIDYNVAWILLTFFGYLGVHRFYMRQWFTGALWLFTGGFFLIGWLYDFVSLNKNISSQNHLENTNAS